MPSLHPLFRSAEPLFSLPLPVQGYVSLIHPLDRTVLTIRSASSVSDHAIDADSQENVVSGHPSVLCGQNQDLL
jgi:hypothetical protein